MNNTAYISVEVSKNTPENRTSPVYVQEKGKLSLNDILSEKPADFNGQIDISWLHNALNLKICTMGRSIYAKRIMDIFCLWR